MDPKKNTTRRDKLISMEHRARMIWERNQYFTVEPSTEPKFFMTFPFPYMNGKLHLGHAFSLTKCDFNAWYKRLCGFNVLFPFGFHCTGMPISAASKKLSYEFEQFGLPPTLPHVAEREDKDTKYQYQVMQEMDIPAKEIPEFVQARHWVDYFPPIGELDVNRLGGHIDFARSFITTEINPYFDSFIRWQFTILKDKGYIKFGKRPSIYSPKDKQICMDHDRSEGEGVVPEQYTIIKIQVLQMNQAMKQLEGRKVFLVAATLRPETMYGQTSCYLLPLGEYIAVEMKDDEVFICSERSAKNMAYQGLTKVQEVVEVIARFKGQELMGLPLCAPLAVHEKIFTLPMMTISMKKGTGVVTCVPSDSPDDWMATSDLRAKKGLREKYNISQEMVSLLPIQIIETSLGRLSAINLCEQLKIKSQNDREQLQKAKEECYKKGFHEGIMLVGQFKGTKVTEVKNHVRKQLIDRKLAHVYYEPNGNAVSRSGDECVVCYCDQWYLNYADENWKKRVLAHVETNFKCNSQTLHKDIVYTINWLKQWGCSRSFGLGTKLPFDEQYLIESLSDSTIYFAYYTIAHYLQGDVQGKQPGLLGIRPEDITPDFWNYILLGQPYTSSKVPVFKLDLMRKSFLYWYPLDLRCSAKDLIKNHLTMALFNHAAIWDDEAFWPRGYYCNGYIMVEGDKMAKSKGNFITIGNAIDDYGADATRLACALAGDSINDANFTKENANSSIMQLSTLEMFLGKAYDQRQQHRLDSNDEKARYYDDIFESQIENQISKVKQAYEKMVYRDVVKYGLHDLVYYKDLYILNCDALKPRRDLIERYVYLQLLFLYPLCPHFCQVAYLDYLLPMSLHPDKYPALIGSCLFPTPRIEINQVAIRSHQYYLKLMVELREAHSKAIKPKKGQQAAKLNKAIIIYRSKFQDYQIEAILLLKTCILHNEIRADWRNEVKTENKDQRTRLLKFGGFIEKEYKTLGKQALQQILPYNELKVLYNFSSNIRKEIALQIDFVQVSQAPQRENKGWKQLLNNVTPGNPTVIFE